MMMMQLFSSFTSNITQLKSATVVALPSCSTRVFLAHAVFLLADEREQYKKQWEVGPVQSACAAVSTPEHQEALPLVVPPLCLESLHEQRMEQAP